MFKTSFAKFQVVMVLCTHRGVGNKKLTTPICLPNDIKIRVNSTYLLASCKLFFVVVHFGEAVSAGHFVSHVVNSDEKNDCCRR